ncbi:acyl-CoA N-acyltransferase [Mycena polygramma]|nr:acyl-CoA N-acyltransferase [Mycena polygramma]
MADTTGRPNPVIVPRPGGDIIIRQYQPKDASQVHALLVEGLIYGPESPHNVAQQRNLTGRISCVAYLGFVLGLGCLWKRNLAAQVSGAALCLGATALFFYMRHSITQMFVVFCATARKTDMADIPTSYDVPSAINGVQSPTPQGPAGFWVAVIESPTSKKSEVVGYLGLDYRASPDPLSGELRRMIVSMNHRRRRIGSLLITAAMGHARHHAPPLETLDLETSEFQPGARKLYENHGFSLVGTRIMRMGPIFSMTVLRLRRQVRD